MVGSFSACLVAAWAMFSPSPWSSKNGHLNALAFSAGPGACTRRMLGGQSLPRGTALSSAVTTATIDGGEEASGTRAVPLEEHEVAGCFGRLADRELVLAPEEVTGTAASGYEFGVLQSGRPKWLCSYLERTGRTQGGGAEVTHTPKWRSLLFGDCARLTEEDLARIVGGAPFEMPLGPSPGMKKAAAEARADGEGAAIVPALWTLFGGSEDEGDGITEEIVSASLVNAANEYGSNGDGLTYAAFKRALEGQGN